MQLFSKKPHSHLSDTERSQVLEAIRQAESDTTGEIRVFIESRCKYVDAYDRAKEVFFQLEMEQTIHRNAVLVYLATKDQQIALCADQDIFEKTKLDHQFWLQLIQDAKLFFQNDELGNGIAHIILKLGKVLHTHYPLGDSENPNELPDDIIFGD